jgi:hypothetical protein
MGKVCSTAAAVNNKISVFKPEGERPLRLNGLESGLAAVNWLFSANTLTKFWFL